MVSCVKVCRFVGRAIHHDRFSFQTSSKFADKTHNSHSHCRTLSVQYKHAVGCIEAFAQTADAAVFLGGQSLKEA